jgi:predicted outer membrane repeat protein
MLLAAARPARRAVRALLLLLSLALAASTVEVHVEPGGEWAGQVEAAGAGVVVFFAPGRYGGCSTGGLKLANGVALVGRAGAAVTVIDCEGAGRHFAVKDGDSVRIEGLTLTGGASAGVAGNSSEGGCVLVAGPGGSVVVADSVFSNCSAATRGGAIAVRGSAALNISRSNFTGNRAGEGGGAIYAAASTLNVSSSRFEWNSAGTRGGAVAVTERAVLDLSDTLFESNRVLVAEHYETGVAGGGAIFAHDGCSTRLSGRSELIDNTVPSSTETQGTGGGVGLWAGSTLLIEGPAMFLRNSAGYGGAVHAFDRSRSGPHKPAATSDAPR